jgi:transcription initiation factor IIE alpha subunit
MAACDYANFVLRSYRRLVLEELTFTVNEQKLKRVTDLIKNHGEVAHREVCNFTRYRKRELDELLQSLVEMGKVKAGKGPKGGKVWRWTDGDTSDDELF